METNPSHPATVSAGKSLEERAARLASETGCRVTIGWDSQWGQDLRESAAIVMVLFDTITSFVAPSIEEAMDKAERALLPYLFTEEQEEALYVG